MKTKKLILKMLAPALLLAFAALSSAQVQDTGEGSMQVTGNTPRILPLKHTEVKAEISGFVAEVTVTQVFSNPIDKPIEAVYVFPLPENAAVNEMTLTVADRIIKGQIKKREEAKQIYEQAKAQGKTAALLDQERPNIFTQSVANIPPGHEIRVTLKYIQNLDYDHGVYKFSFPMTVGPRYIPGQAAGKNGTGWSPDTDAVRDASRITPPVTRPGQRSGRDISVEVKLKAGIAVKNIRSSSHEITLKTLGDTGAEVGLDPDDRIPNKDFLLTYEPAGKAVDAAVLAHKDGKEGYLTLMVQPSADFPLSQVTPKELVFALDVSGSMGGFPLETAKETALRCLEGMNPGDTFQIFSFASGNKLHFDRPLKNTPENVALGRSVINGIRGGGGTEMLDALRQVLEFPKDPERMRIVLFMTDGYVGDDTQILGFVKEHLNNSRIFPLGVGSSPNRYLLEEMAVLGKGTVQYVRQDEKPAKLEKMIERFYDRIAKPVLTDLTVDWKGLDVMDPSPAVMRDLFAGQPVFIHARYRNSGSGPVILRGNLRGQPWKMAVKVDLPARETANAAMGPLWARARITELTRAMYGKEDAGLKERIVQLALEHRLVTEYTSFVAVDESTASAGQTPMVVPVESELPEGTRYEGFFGASGGGLSGARGGMQSMFSGAAGGFGSAKMASPAAFRGSVSKSGYANAYLAAAPEQADKKTAAEPAPKGESRVAALAGELLAAPSRRLVRQLVSLQDGSGAFLEPGGGKVSLADHALALLALAKAKSVFGAELDGALQNAWNYLRGNTPAGLGAKLAVTNALKGGPYLNRAGVLGELEALSPVLEKLK
ncbi:MAG: VIT domain-containing protein [Elusimicrobiota bacterium]|nr:VIT domain-containing protein [Elusimicrobiota bacterium]